MLAGLALGNGLDRIGGSNLAVAARVPSLFASESLRSGGRALIDQGNALGAIEVGKLAIKDAPLDPSSAAILGAGKLGAGDKTGAERAFRLAGKLGWRIPYTQAYWMNEALAAKDYRVAALRLDALLRQYPKLMHQRILVSPFELKGQARAELAKRMKDAPWTHEYAFDVADLEPIVIAQRTMVLTEMGRQDTALGCDTIAPIVSRLIGMNVLADAATLWRGHCPGAGGALVYDGDFARADMTQSHSEFAWTFIGLSDVGLVLEPSATGKGRELVVDSTATAPRQFLRQLVLAKPGSYRLTWRAEGDAGAAGSQIEASLACGAMDFIPLPATQDPQSKLWSANAVIDGSCTARWLAFRIKPGTARLTLGDVALKPL